MVSSGMLRRVALVRTDVSEELTASLIRVARIGELGTTLVLTSNRRIPKRRFLQEPRGVTSQKTPFFILLT
jgi:DNA-binding TFAR19-related protein (PDSD5 family)